MLEGVKLHIKFFSVAILILFFISCESVKNKEEELKNRAEEKVLTENLQQVNVEISGMTCEIGCARLIQSKLYKADGITYAKISFEDSSGIVQFDKNRISEKDIKNVIEKTAGGDLYSVVSINRTKVLDSISSVQ